MKEKKKITLVRPYCSEPEKTRRLSDVLRFGLRGYEVETLESTEVIAAADLRDRKILFAIELGESGINLSYCNLLKRIRMDRQCLEGSVAGIVVDSKGELFTKSVCRHLAFSANRAGATFPGRPLVEGTASLKNFNIVAQNLHTDNYDAYRRSVRELADRIADFGRERIRRPNLLVLHAGSGKRSNTMGLWKMIREGLDADITEISLDDGEIYDCRGCNYETCLHLGEQSKCFYGGVITREVYPAISRCDGLVMICPNYNDAVSANLTAFINRMTALFRVQRFFGKRLYAVIVSGYSGSDIVAEQLISALNMNKTFMLPPRFALMRIANDPGSIYQVPNIREDALGFAGNIMKEFHRN